MHAPFSFGLAGSWLLLAAGTAHGFGGQIAVGMNAANEVDQIDVSFTADATLETADYSMQSKIYFHSGKLRDEIDLGGQQLTYISRADLGTTWVLMPQSMYIEVPHGQSSEQIQEFKLVEREIVGEETINGMDTTKYRVVYESNDGSYGGFTWFNDDNIAVRSFMVSESDGEQVSVNFEMSNLQVGAVDESLFELPAGAQELNLSGLIGGARSVLPGSDSSDSGAEPGEAVPPGVAEELLEAAQQGAEDAATEETRRGVKDAVGRGLRGIFNRD